MNQEFERISRLPPYVFNEVNTFKALERSKGRDIIDLGMGNPDIPTPKHIVEKLISTVREPRTHRYSSSKGIIGLRKAQCKYYERRFGVKLDPESEVIVTLGSKEGLANLATAMSISGDRVFVPDPSYPIHPYGFIIAGVNVERIPMGPNVDFLKELRKAINKQSNQLRALVLNFPSNPTAQTVDLAFYEEVIELCYKNKIWVLSDLAYSEIYFDDNPPPSILQIKKAREIAIEFSSMSKSYSMPGWRVGFAVGNKKLVAALTRIKSYLDYGAFTPIQVASVAALNGNQKCLSDIREVYKERRDVLISSMRRAGWLIPSPPATMFAWAPIPDPYKKLGSLLFSKALLRYAQVAVSPGVGFGKCGEGYVRISLVENSQRIRQASRNIKNFLKNIDPNMIEKIKMDIPLER